MTDKCPKCGRFVENEADGFYGTLDPDTEFSEIRVFCDETCYDKFAASERASKLPEARLEGKL